MTRSRHIILSFIGLLILLTIGQSGYSQVWVEQNSGTTRALHSISYCDSLNGFAVGDSGTVLHTTNAGATWVPQSTPGGPTKGFQKVLCLTPLHAYIVGKNYATSTSTLLATTNGGTKWNVTEKNDFRNYRSFCFVDWAYGFLLCADSIYKTTDGGISWKSSDPPNQYLRDISFSDHWRGMAVGWYETIVTTTDAGQTWQNRYGPVYDENLNVVSCIDYLHATAAGSNGLALKTNDGGIHWNAISALPHESFTSLSLYDTSYGSVLSPQSLSMTSTADSSWQTLSGVGLQGVCQISPKSIAVVMSNGAILRTISPEIDPPPIRLAGPPNGATGVEGVQLNPLVRQITIHWNLYAYLSEYLRPYSVTLEYGTDSNFATNTFNIILSGPFVFTDTSTTLSLPFGTKIYWRMQPFFSNVPTPWSETWNFTTAEMTIRTVREIQEVPPSYLLRADSAQLTNWQLDTLQYSPFSGTAVTLIARCEVPAAPFASNTPIIFVTDTATADAPWHGIEVAPNTFAEEDTLKKVKKGDILKLTGTIQEVTSGTMNSMTTLLLWQLQVIGHGDTLSHVQNATVETFFRGAPLSGGKIIYSTGEQYEGMYIELHHLTVVSTDPIDGTMTLRDSAGNELSTFDASRWFTFEIHRDPLSTYELPVIGSIIDTLRGIIIASNYRSSFQTYRISPVYPGDLVYAPSQHGILRGKLFNDDNRNGVQDAGEEPLAHWSILLPGRGKSALTDSTGEFLFHNLPPGSYTLSEPTWQFPPWQLASPPSGAYSLARGANDSSGYFLFGNYYPRGVIGGVLFDDDNRNGIRDSAESPLQYWQIDLSGNIQGFQMNQSRTTDIQGKFSFANLPAGTYTISEPEQQHAPWQVSFPPSRSYSVPIGINDTSAIQTFAFYYPWDWIDGKVFYDANENLIPDTNEAPLAHWKVKLGGAVRDSTWTDSLGHYSFRHSLEGDNIISIVPMPAWEVIPPSIQSGYHFTFYNLGQQKSNANIPVHRIPPRVKLKMTIHDNTQYLRQDIWWGVRPGATDGIGGADGNASNFDISEGESEIPPRSFAEYVGLFDARFMDPGNAIGYFGYGSWTDIRSFYSPLQSNTYRIAVLPGYSSGGSYPITLIWSRDSVSSHYNGSVTLDDRAGTIIDMRSRDSMVVTNPATEFLYLSGLQPQVSSQFAIQWHIISLPVEVPHPSPKTMFTTAQSAAFAYPPGSSYQRCDSLVPGVGYWLKYSKGLDTLPTLGPARLNDTLHLAQGWNLIGTLSVPVDVRSVSTTPSDLINNFYYYEGRYLIADTLRPAYGYWVKAKQAGDLILGGTGASELAKSTGDPPSLKSANVLRIIDASGREEALYFGTGGTEDAYELPPRPPEGVFDVRFGTNSLYAPADASASAHIPLEISSATYPVSIRWEVKTLLITGRLLVGKHETPLRMNGSIEIDNAEESISLSLNGVPDLPKEFALEQNYPNPFNPVTVIRYQLPANGYVTLRIYDVLGRSIATLVDEGEEAGYREIRWDGRNSNRESVGTGVYFYRMEVSGSNGKEVKHADVKKMLMIR